MVVVLPSQALLPGADEIADVSSRNWLPPSTGREKAKGKANEGQARGARGAVSSSPWPSWIWVWEVMVMEGEICVWARGLWKRGGHDNTVGNRERIFSIYSRWDCDRKRGERGDIHKIVRIGRHSVKVPKCSRRHRNWPI